LKAGKEIQPNGQAEGKKPEKRQKRVSPNRVVHEAEEAARKGYMKVVYDATT